VKREADSLEASIPRLLEVLDLVVKAR